MSSICSVPMESRIVFGLIPQASSSSLESWEWVVEAGWITSDFTSATFASKEKSSNDSVNFFAVLASPFISNVKMDAAPFGKYR